MKDAQDSDQAMLSEDLISAIKANSFAWTTRACKARAPDARAANGEPAIGWAAREGFHKALSALLAAGADPNATDEKGRVALMAAMQPFDPALRLAMLKNLLSAGADARAKTALGATVAMFAAQSGDAKCLQELAKAGADLKATTDAGASAAVIAAKAEHWGALAFLAGHGALGGVDRDGRSVEAIARAAIDDGSDIDPADWARLERAWLAATPGAREQKESPRL